MYFSQVISFLLYKCRETRSTQNDCFEQVFIFEVCSKTHPKCLQRLQEAASDFRQTSLLAEIPQMGRKTYIENSKIQATAESQQKISQVTSPCCWKDILDSLQRTILTENTQARGQLKRIPGNPELGVLEPAKSLWGPFISATGHQHLEGAANSWDAANVICDTFSTTGISSLILCIILAVCPGVESCGRMVEASFYLFEKWCNEQLQNLVEVRGCRALKGEGPDATKLVELP